MEARDRLTNNFESITTHYDGDYDDTLQSGAPL